MSQINKSKLSDKQKRALPFFIGCRRYDEACKAAGISRTTFYSWMEDPLFKTALAEVQKQALDNAVQILNGSITKAADTLIKLLDVKDNPGVVRSTANDIFNLVVKFDEISRFNTRLIALEIHAGVVGGEHEYRNAP